MLISIEKTEVSLFLLTPLEQTMERRKAYYVLEQFYEDIRDRTDRQPNEIEQHLHSYFSKPENIEFFEKNKIKWHH